jgi:hypothetical protein
MDAAEVARLAKGAGIAANQLIEASEGLSLMKRCVDENLGSVTVTQKQCDALIWMMQTLRQGPSDG